MEAKIDNMMNKQNKFMKFINSFTLYEKLWFCSVVALVIMFTCIFPDLLLEDETSWLTIVCSIIAILANPACELMISKQNRYNFIVSIVFIEITETIIYLSLGYYISAIISLAFWIPIDIISFVNWTKNRDENKKELTKVKRLTWLQDVFMVLAIVAFGLGMGYMLQLVGEEDSYLDAFVAAIGMANGILLYFRYNEQWYAWFIYLVFDAVLWIRSGHMIMLITTFAMLTNTVYGFIKWLIYIKNKKIESQKNITNNLIDSEGKKQI